MLITLEKYGMKMWSGPIWRRVWINDGLMGIHSNEQTGFMKEGERLRCSIFHIPYSMFGALIIRICIKFIKNKKNI
jgi:hypothetical protein